MLGIPAAAPLQEQRRIPGLGVTSSTSRKHQPDLAHRLKDMPNGKMTSRSRDRIPEIPTAAPFAVGLARAGGGVQRSSAADDITSRKGCLLGQCYPFPASRPTQNLHSASPQLKSLTAQSVWSLNPRSATVDSILMIVATVIPLDHTT